MRRRPSDEQPEAAGGGEEAEAGGGGNGGQQPEAGRGERGASQPGQGVRRTCCKFKNQEALRSFIHSLRRRWRRVDSLLARVLAQQPAAGPEGEDSKGGGGGDEGHSELHRGRPSSRLRTRQTYGRSTKASHGSSIKAFLVLS